MASIADQSNPTKILDTESFPTKTPEITLQKVAEFFNDKNIKALGIASFGPIDINPQSTTFFKLKKLFLFKNFVFFSVFTYNKLIF